MTSFSPPGVLKNKHVQSILATLKLRRPLVVRRVKPLLRRSHSVILDCGDGVKLQGYYADHLAGASKLAILIHGWEGSAESTYILSAAGHLFQQGFDVFRLNLRDHGTSHHLNKDLFHSCRLQEVVGAVRHIQALFPHPHMYLGGFSLGGNFSLRVAAAAPEAGLKLSKVMAISPVLSPERALLALEQGWAGYRLYFMKKWRRSLRKKQACFPESYDFLDFAHLRSITSMSDYFVHQYTDFDNLTTYLNGYSVIGEVLSGLQIPTKLIISADDPVIPAVDLAHLATSPYLEVVQTEHGGHCGFIKNYQLHSWIDSEILQFFQ